MYKKKRESVKNGEGKAMCKKNMKMSRGAVEDRKQIHGGGSS